MPEPHPSASADHGTLPELLSYAQAARRVGVHPALLRREVDDGRLPVFTVRGRRMFAVTDLVAWLNACRQPARVA